MEGEVDWAPEYSCTWWWSLDALPSRYHRHFLTYCKYACGKESQKLHGTMLTQQATRWRAWSPFG
jgi:hypothetical protein